MCYILRPSIVPYIIFIIFVFGGRKNNCRCTECAFFVVILSSSYSTRIDPVTEGHNLEADILLYFGSTFHTCGERHCLQLQSRSNALVYSETEVTSISETSVSIYQILRLRKPAGCNSVTYHLEERKSHAYNS